MARKISSISGAPGDDTPPESGNSRLDAVNGVFQMVQMGCVMGGQYADAGAIGMHGEAISTEVVAIADTNPRIARAVDYLMEVGPYAGLVGAVLPLVLQLAANHKVIPAEKVPGVMSPEILTMQMESELQKQAMAQMQEAARVKAEFDAMTASMEATLGPNGPESNGDAAE
jgi:hypothetical protein